jgi:hypothetical protein
MSSVDRDVLFLNHPGEETAQISLTTQRLPEAVKAVIAAHV